MANDDLVIDPWGSAQSTDYDRIIEQFGLTPMDGVTLTNLLNSIDVVLCLLTEMWTKFSRLSGRVPLSVSSPV